MRTLPKVASLASPPCSTPTAGCRWAPPSPPRPGPPAGDRCPTRASPGRMGVPVPEPRTIPEAPTPALQPLLTVEDVAALLRLRPSTVRAYAERGSLACVRIGGRLRFQASDVSAWVAQRHSKGGR